MITKMRYASVTVTDIAQAVDFYVGKLGFRIVIQMPLPGGNQFVMVAPPEDGANLVFSLPVAGKPHTPSTFISFETSDINATYTELTAKGIEFTRQPSKTPWGGMEAAFVDPFGNTFMLQQGGL